MIPWNTGALLAFCVNQGITSFFFFPFYFPYRLCCHPEGTPGSCWGWTPATNLDSIFKSRDITLPTKVCLVKAMVFPVVMYGCESWTIKKAECQRIDAFELWFWRRLLRVPWTARRSNQSILKEVSPEYSLEGLIWSWNYKTLATWCEELTHGKDPDAGKDWRQEEKGKTEDEMVGWHYQLNGQEFEQALGDGQGSLACCSPWATESDMTEWLSLL